MKRLNATGSHIVAVAVIVLVLGVAGFGAYAVTHQDKASDTTAQTTTASSDAINSAADLNDAANTLDNSSTQVDSNLDDSSLDADLNDLL
jgi:hypothetical protein